jgi:hypothetical protein
MLRLKIEAISDVNNDICFRPKAAVRNHCGEWQV